MENYSSNIGLSQIVRTNSNDEEYFERLPKGWYFIPTDEELISEYLIKKINNQPLPRNIIHEVNIYKYHPRYLCSNYKLTRSNDWYFFSSRERKYPNGNRPNRAAGDNGYWKASSGDVSIKAKDKDKDKEIGTKKTLNYIEGSAKDHNGEKTNWIMHEFRITQDPDVQNRQPNDMMLDKWVLCRIRYKPPPKSSKKHDEDNQSQNSGQAFSIAPIEAHQDLPPHEPVPLNQYPISDDQLMAYQYQNPLFVDLPQYQSPLPEFEPPELPSLVELTEFGSSNFVLNNGVDQCEPSHRWRMMDSIPKDTKGKEKDM